MCVVLKWVRSVQTGICSFYPHSTLVVCLFIYFYFYLVLAALGLCCCTRAFSSRGEQGLHFLAVRGLLTAVASLVAEHGL